MGTLESIPTFTGWQIGIHPRHSISVHRRTHNILLTLTSRSNLSLQITSVVCHVVLWLVMVQLPVRQSGICPHPPKKKSKGGTSEGSIHPEFRIFFRSEGVKPCGMAGHSLKDGLRSSQYPTPSISIWASSLGCCPWHVQLVRKPQGRLRKPSPVSLSLSDSWWKEHFYDLYDRVGYDIDESL